MAVQASAKNNLSHSVSEARSLAIRRACAPYAPKISDYHRNYPTLDEDKFDSLVVALTKNQKLISAVLARSPERVREIVSAEAIVSIAEAERRNDPLIKQFRALSAPVDRSGIDARAAGAIILLGLLGGRAPAVGTNPIREGFLWSKVQRCPCFEKSMFEKTIRSLIDTGVVREWKARDGGYSLNLNSSSNRSIPLLTFAQFILSNRADLLERVEQLFNYDTPQDSRSKGSRITFPSAELQTDDNHHMNGHAANDSSSDSTVEPTAAVSNDELGSPIEPALSAEEETKLLLQYERDAESLKLIIKNALQLIPQEPPHDDMLTKTLRSIDEIGESSILERLPARLLIPLVEDLCALRAQLHRNGLRNEAGLIAYQVLSLASKRAEVCDSIAEQVTAPCADDNHKFSVLTLLHAVCDGCSERPKIFQPQYVAEKLSQLGEGLARWHQTEFAGAIIGQILDAAKNNHALQEGMLLLTKNRFWEKVLEQVMDEESGTQSASQ